MHESPCLMNLEGKQDLYDPNSPLYKRVASFFLLLRWDREVRSSFTRQGSMVYTKRPSRKSLLKRFEWNKIHAYMRKGQKDECDILKEKVEEMQMKILEKDKLIELAENTKKQMKALEQKHDELKHQALEKDSLLMSAQQQLLDVKIELADKQSALEKIQWEAMTSNKKVEKLQEELDSMQGDISLFTSLLKSLTKPNTVEYADDYDIKPYDFNHLPIIAYGHKRFDEHFVRSNKIEMDDLDEIEMQKMDEARKTYIAAVVAVKEKQDEESIATVVNARLQLQSILFKQKKLNV
ncbi:Protein MICROTUBULE BINDING PROTEIN 2C, partial [Mucuna pruriens]